jgi:hypothetical protein
MKWKREYFGRDQRIAYVSGEYRIIQTQDANMFTKRPMGHQNQRWEIFKNGEKIDWMLTLKDAKAYVENLSRQEVANI